MTGGVFGRCALFAAGVSLLAACTSVTGAPERQSIGASQPSAAPSTASATGPPATASTGAQSSAPTTDDEASSVPALPPGATVVAPPTFLPTDRGHGLLWTSTDLTPLGQPAAVGGDVALYGERNGILYIEVVDAATGKALWSKPAAPGNVASGVAIDPVVIGAHVVYLRPSPRSMFRDRVVVADALTGRDLAVSKLFYDIGDRPTECSGQVCFTARGFSGADGLRMNATTGVVTVDAARAGLEARTIGPDGLLSIQNQGEPEQLARVADGKLVWKSPLAGVFGVGFSSDYGWSFKSFDKRKLLVGTIGAQPVGGRDATSYALGSGAEMVGIDVATGTRRWIQTGGITYDCLPNIAVTPDSALAAVRCRWGKSATIQVDRDKRTDILRAAPVSVEGFDPATGRTTWSVPLADASGESFENWLKSFEVSGEQTLVVKGPKGLLTINPITGATSPAAAGTQVTCSDQIATAIRGANLADQDGKPYNSYSSGVSLHACDTAGAPMALAGAWPSWAGATAGGVHVVTTPAGLQGYRG